MFTGILPVSFLTNPQSFIWSNSAYEIWINDRSFNTVPVNGLIWFQIWYWSCSWLLCKSKLRLSNLVILFQVKCKSPGVICWFAGSHYSVTVLRVIFLKTYHGSGKSTFSLSPILWPYYYTLSFMIFSSLGMLSRICLKIPWKEALISVCVNLVILTILKRHSTVVNLSCFTQSLCTITNYFICCLNVSVSLRLSHFYLYFWVTLTYFCTTNVILYFLCNWENHAF